MNDKIDDIFPEGARRALLARGYKLIGREATEDVVEAVARAMFADDHDEAWEDGEQLTKDIYLRNARTAIEARWDAAP